MIARMWHGRVATAKADRYRDFLIARAIPDYRSVAGNLAVHVLERPDGEVTHFVTLSFCQSPTRRSSTAISGGTAKGVSSSLILAGSALRVIRCSRTKDTLLGPSNARLGQL